MTRRRDALGRPVKDTPATRARRKEQMIYRRSHAPDPKPHSAAELIAYISDEGDSNYDIGSRLGINGASVGRWVATDRHFTDWEADRWAIYLKVHPCEIWSTWWDAARLDEEELVGSS